ncbi:MAG: nucleotidyltransferase domain-containing protein [Acutalibacteraceae bacterium]|nr:nucleotidyltransferase domain-containing protein [Acutalibacteraceae bacterium]
MTIKLNEDIKNVLEELKANSLVDAIAIAGSRASGNGDERSDYDVYIYSTGNEAVPESTRDEIYNKYCSKYETGNKYFEYEDNIVLNCGVFADIIFRNFEMIENIQRYVADNCGARLGYTTAFWHNLNESQVYCDKSGRFTELQKKYDIPYPEQLKKNIIEKNMNMLSGVLPSYDMQIKKAVERNDIVSICHRTAEYMASYFDVIFALNEMFHPGEKRLIQICKTKCSILPKDFEENITKLYESMYSGYDFNVLESMYLNLKELTEKI